MAQFVIVGAGQAGCSLAAKLRSEGFTGKIVMIGEEPVIPYQRPPLSKKYLLGEMQEDQLYLRPQRFYEENNIDLRVGKRVSQIDRSSKTVSVDSKKINYDQLAITTGSYARKLPAQIGGELGNVFTVRTLADMNAMSKCFAQGARVLVVGGGYIGLEAAAVAAKKGMQVALVEMAERILQRVASKETADFFRKLHTSHGVEIKEGVGVSVLKGEDVVRSAVLSDGTELEADFVVVGVGIDPVTELAENAGLQIENGIWTDELGRTTDPSIWAAGDCASFEFRGRRIRLESVPHAVEHAECVAKNMLGGNEAYLAHPWFWSDQYDVKLQIAGLHHGYDMVVTQLGRREGSMSFWYYHKNELVAVDAINDPKAYMTGRRIIESQDKP
ncbi:pyridine nucleotide-disulfide oxidoreductase [Rhodobacteraceae bacterium RKSG542]|uniref:NAD(P)/FAD-dependent oxidoreductase n=1 Tax=Pseudovibrio flavus TaxID=2529854 RepID=UPI0012BB91CF|nr:FAD-dependent oxidoreductase [Pseudovibrio flavus]MTI16500.1 pyridine nucleotide-disulfide oxidoreductase [Pseudovibrio flavus]